MSLRTKVTLRAYLTPTNIFDKKSKINYFTRKKG